MPGRPGRQDFLLRNFLVNLKGGSGLPVAAVALHVALHWATRHPGRIAGVVMVDGGYPWD
jgi:hypothetical protein